MNTSELILIQYVTVLQLLWNSQYLLKFLHVLQPDPTDLYPSGYFPAPTVIDVPGTWSSFDM